VYVGDILISRDEFRMNRTRILSKGVFWVRICHGFLGSRPSNRLCLARVRQGVKAVLEEVLQEEMTEHLEAGYRKLTPKDSSGIHREFIAAC
jgi:hypothetical protein